MSENPIFAGISGGRTSMYLLWLFKDKGVTFLFQNTGREREETYEFLRDAERFWGVKIIWLEYTYEKPLFKVVDFETADRTGKPFEAIITKKQRVPNKRERFCTQELKVKTARRYIRSLGIKHWTTLVGFRADEPKRVADLAKRYPGKTIRETVEAPLFNLGVTAEDVGAFWKTQPFDLRLPLLPNGKTFGGNCRGCFWHSEYQQAMLVRNDPEAVDWLVAQEKRVGGTFINGQSWEEFANHVKKLRVVIEDDDLEKELYCQNPLGSCHL